MKTVKLFVAATVTVSTLFGSSPARAVDSAFSQAYHHDDRGRYDDRGRSDGRWDSSGPRRGDLERIGVVTARGPEHENDLLELPRGRRYTAIQFRVASGDVLIEHIRVTFGDDTAFEPTVSPIFREGDRTCRIDLPGYDREIKRVRIHYHSLTRGTSVVEIFGVVA